MRPIVTELDTRKIPPERRFEDWLDAFCRWGVRLEVRCDHRTDFAATSRMLDLGLLRVVAHRYPPLEMRRTARLIRRDDPELSQLMLNLRGQLILRQGCHTIRLNAYDLAVLDCSRPFEAVHFVPAGVQDQAEAITVRLTHDLLAVPTCRRGTQGVRRLSGREGVSALLSRYLRDVADHADEYRPADAARLGPVTLDLVAATLASQLAPDPTKPRVADDETTYARVHTFVERHLGDPELSPRMVASAQHISLRTLHRIFHAHGGTVAALIRTRRLERCRRDLADPQRSAEPIHAVAARWGFRDPAHFSRTFRAEYGISPHSVRNGPPIRPAAPDADGQRVTPDGDVVHADN